MENKEMTPEELDVVSGGLHPEAGMKDASISSILEERERERQKKAKAQDEQSVLARQELLDGFKPVGTMTPDISVTLAEASEDVFSSMRKKRP
ncbi:MAG: hypothetical protein IJP92_17160 [Lachnospiraceae bacterium]|nr:hypothetical protein [Lachnospiraceae bacterium]